MKLTLLRDGVALVMSERYFVPSIQHQRAKRPMRVRARVTSYQCDSIFEPFEKPTLYRRPHGMCLRERRNADLSAGFIEGHRKQLLVVHTGERRSVPTMTVGVAQEASPGKRLSRPEKEEVG